MPCCFSVMADIKPLIPAPIMVTSRSCGCVAGLGGVVLWDCFFAGRLPARKARSVRKAKKAARKVWEFSRPNSGM